MKSKTTVSLSVLLSLCVSGVHGQGSGGDSGAALVIDAFDAPTEALEARDLEGMFPVSVGTTAVDSMLGGELDVLLVLDAVENPGDAAYLAVGEGRAVFRQDASSLGSALFIWDGVDGDPVRTVASTGLGGGMDLTLDGSLDGIDLDVARNDLPLKIGLVLFTGIDNISEQVLDVSVIDTPTTLRFPFSDLTDSGAQGADLTRVTTLMLVVGTLDSAVGPAHIEIDRILANASSLPAGPGGADPAGPSASGMLLDQIEELPSSAIWSVDFPGQNNWDAAAADDLSVPEGATWTVFGVEWAVEWFPEPPPNPSVNVTIFENDGRVPGDPLFTQADLPMAPAGDSTSNWEAMLPEPWELGPGDYWLSVQANVPIGFEMLIKESRIPHGLPYVWQNPGNAFGTFCTSWEDGISCGGNEPSLALRLLGVAGTPCSEADVLVTDIAYMPAHPRAGEPFTVEVTVENQGCEDSDHVFIDWFANLATDPGFNHNGNLLDSTSLAPNQSFTLMNTFVYPESGTYNTYVRLRTDPISGIGDTIHGPTELCIAAAHPVAHWFDVHATDEGLVVTDGHDATLLDQSGQALLDISTTTAPVVLTWGDRIVVIDGLGFTIFDQNGNQIGSRISTTTTPTIKLNANRLVVIDGMVVTIYDKDGRRITGPISTAHVPVVTTTGNRIVIVDGNQVTFYDSNGTQIGAAISTQQPPTVYTNGTRFLVVEGNNVTIYDQNAQPVRGTIRTTHAPRVFATGDRLVIIDGHEIKLYDNNGVQQGSPITTRNRPTVYATGQRIVVVDGNEVRLFDKNGNQVGSTIATTRTPVVRSTGDRIVVLDGNEIKLYDENGTQVGSPITTASAPRVTTVGDRIVVIENNQVRIFDKQGTRVGSPIITGNAPIIRTTDNRIIIIDGHDMSIYDTSGNRISGPIPLNPRQAQVVHSEVSFAPGERELALWLPMSGPGEISLESSAGLSAEAYDREGDLLDGTGSAKGAITSLRSDVPSDFCMLMLSRPDDLLRTPQRVEIGVAFDDPLATFMEETPEREFTIHSPIRAFPGGLDVLEVPEDYPYASFAEFVESEYGYAPELGILGLQWFVNGEILRVLWPPAGHPGALPPTGASHDDNYCGISTFIHSMETTFPGALKANVTTNAASWDEVGDNLDHSCWFGIRGAKMVTNVNKNYGGNNPATQNGKKYCAKWIRDSSPANLAAWTEDCNVKVLVYDFMHFFGHWADVTSVTPDPTDANKASLNLQDYAANYNVAFSHLTSGDQIDFSAAPLNNTMRGNFDAGNPIAGDDTVPVLLTPRPEAGKPIDVPTEEVWFYVVCECDATTNATPTTTKSGKTLNP